MQIRPAEQSELTALAELAGRCQAVPARRIPYLDNDAAALAEEVVGTEPGEWWPRTLVAVDDDGEAIGWLLADTDEDMGRTWWNGPFIDPRIDEAEVAPIADALYAAFDAPTQEQELSFDPAAAWMVAFADRHGFEIVEGSAALGVAIPAEAAASDPSIRQLDTDTERAAVAELHDQLFPGTHITGRSLASGDDDDRLTLGKFAGDQLVGYISVEFPPGNSLYIDFLGVDPAHRGRGHGATMVADALQRAAEAGYARAHLTVRTSNAGARRIYERLHFVEEQLIIPARKGFGLE